MYYFLAGTDECICLLYVVWDPELILMDTLVRQQDLHIALAGAVLTGKAMPLIPDTKHKYTPTYLRSVCIAAFTAKADQDRALLR